ncbi:MAG: class I SAM-dependent methyltransferase, partial [Bradyrhizobium sp.]
ETSRAVAVRDLARRVLTFSSSSPGVLGDQAEAMLHDVEARLAPFSREGFVTEIVVATAQVVRR